VVRRLRVRVCRYRRACDRGIHRRWHRANRRGSAGARRRLRGVRPARPQDRRGHRGARAGRVGLVQEPWRKPAQHLPARRACLERTGKRRL